LVFYIVKSTQAKLPQNMPIVEIDGSRLEFTWYGPKPAEAPTLVFLHGGLGSATAWGEYPQKVAEALGCGALVYSRAGYGSSDPALLPRQVDFMHREAVEMLPKILDAFEVRDAGLIGHSNGGSIAIIYCGNAHTSGAFVHALVLEAPHVFVEELTVNSIAEAVENYNRGDLKKGLEKYHTHVENTFRSWSEIWLNPKFRSWNIEEYLSSIRVPVLVIQGTKDNFGTLAQVKAIQLQCNAPVETKILPGCRHRPHRERSEETLRTAVDFLKNSGFAHGNNT
jgi:pimeloyl-ACP methyl ester carboxylesterase